MLPVLFLNEELILFFSSLELIMPGGAKKDAAAKPKAEETKKDTAPKGDKPAAKEEKKGKGKK